MGTKSFQRHQGDYQLNAVQDNVEEHTKALTDSDIINGNLVVGVKLAAGKVRSAVEHKLGRRPKGYIVVRSVIPDPGGTTPSEISVIEDEDNNNKDKVILLFTSADAINVDLWVF